MATNKLQVKETFTAAQVSTRRRETFVPGELIVLIEGSHPPTESQFIRLIGLRPNNGLECRYTIASEELKQKT